MGRFNKGVFFGGLLGAGLVWLTSTTKGKKTRAQIMKHAEAIYPDVKKKVLSSKAWKTMTKHKYVQLVESTVEMYAKRYALPPSVKRMLVKVVGAQWKHVQAALKAKKK